MLTRTNTLEKSSPMVDLWSTLPLIDAGPVTLDLSEIDYVTSAGLSALVKLRRRLPTARITLLAPRPLTLRVLNTVGFDKMFEIRAH
jgi:anti-anti-sigma factor